MTNQPTVDAIHAAVLFAHQQFMANFQQGNVIGIAALYAKEGQLLPAYSPAIGGRTAIQAFWQGCLDMGIGIVQRTPLEMDCLSNTMNELGEYRFLDHQNRVLDVGKYVVIWKRQHGEWQIYRDIWTSNLAPAQ